MSFSSPKKSFILEGRVYKIFEALRVNPHLIKRELVLGVAKGPSLGPEIAPDLIKIEFTQSNVVLLDHLKIGDDIKVHFNINGREWIRNDQANYFVVLNGTLIEQEGVDPYAHMPEEFRTLRFPKSGGAAPGKRSDEEPPF